MFLEFNLLTALTAFILGCIQQPILLVIPFSFLVFLNSKLEIRERKKRFKGRRESKDIKYKISNKHEEKHRGTLYMRIGPMFSGKTTWLNSELTRLSDTGFCCLKIVHSDDIRDDVASSDNNGTTHNSSYNKLSDKIYVSKTPTLSNIVVDDFEVIGIDEAQFFPDLLDTVVHWIENKGKHIKISGLDGDAFRKRFGQTLDLIPYSDEVVKLNASCKICLDELEKKNFHGNILTINGPFTKRIGSSKEQKVIGGSSEYIPVCRYHLHQNIETSHE